MLKTFFTKQFNQRFFIMFYNLKNFYHHTESFKRNGSLWNHLDKNGFSIATLKKM